MFSKSTKNRSKYLHYDDYGDDEDDINYTEKDLTLSVTKLADSGMKISDDHIRNNKKVINNELNYGDIDSDRGYDHGSTHNRHGGDHFNSDENSESEDVNILDFHDIITDKDTLDFLKKHFSKTSTFDIDIFVNTLFQEFLIRYPNTISQMVNPIEFGDDLKSLMKKSLITSDENRLSLNALEVQTKNKGLYNFVLTLCADVQANTELKLDNEMHEEILEELDFVRKKLDQKNRDLIIYDEKLKEHAKLLKAKEENLKEELQKEYQLLINKFDATFKDKVNSLQKRVIAIEKEYKTKIKTLEGKLKEIKEQSNSKINQEDKLKNKVHTLERNNEFLKMKVVDLEKKIAYEIEARTKTTELNSKLKTKITSLEKTLKEFQDSTKTQIPTTRSPTINLENIIFQSSNEKPLEVIDLNTSTTGREGLLPRDIQQAANQEILEELGEEDDEEKMNDVNSNSTGIRSVGLQKKKMNSNSNTRENLSTAITKKKSSTSSNPITSSKISSINQSTEEIKVLLGIIHSMITCIKSTLPILINEEKENVNDTSMQLGDNLGIMLDDSRVEVIDHGNKSISEIGIANEENNVNNTDIGEIFYPCFNKLIVQIIEIIPLLNRQYNIKDMFSIVEMFYKLVNFVIKFKIQQNLPSGSSYTGRKGKHYSDFDIQQTMNKFKSAQDHVNEIMLVSDSKAILEVGFNPQTEYWKKVTKRTKTTNQANLQNSIITTLKREGKNVGKTEGQPNVQLFSNENIQNELIGIFRKFIDTSAFLLNRNKSQLNSKKDEIILLENDKNLAINLETQKYMQMTRLYLNLIMLLISNQKGDQIYALQSIIDDLNSENVKIGDFLKNFFIDNDGIHIFYWTISFNYDDITLMQLTTDALLVLCCNGQHYKNFIKEISSNERITILLKLFVKHKENNDFCEKLSVIMQRITYHNDLKGKIDEKYIKCFKDKINDLGILVNNEFFLTNLKSIIYNIEGS